MNTDFSSVGERDQISSEAAEGRTIKASISAPERTMTPSRAKDPFMKRLIRWLYPDQRVANRHPLPPVIAYLGLVRTSKEYQVGNISVAGFYMITEERWIIGTGFPITLERTDEEGLGRTLTLHSTVIRNGEDGVAFTFVPPRDETSADKDESSTRVDLTKLAQFLKGLPLSSTDPQELEHTT
jgi:hypothetical protein